MDTRMKKFQKKVMEAMDSHRDQLGLGAPVRGKGENVIAYALVDELNSGMDERALVIARVGDGLCVHCRFVMSIGSTGDTVNRTATHLLGRLFLGQGDGLDKLTADQIALLGLLVDQFRCGPRQIDELIAHVTLGSNDVCKWTRAGVDWRDGEVSVKLNRNCGFDELPESFDQDMGAVLEHAARLIEMESVIRTALSPEPRLPASFLKRLAPTSTESEAKAVTDDSARSKKATDDEIKL